MVALLVLAAPSSADNQLQQQREAFQIAYARAELGDWQSTAAQRVLLADYALWPDLRAAFLQTRIRNKDYGQIDDFLDAYGALKPARELRYSYARALANDGSLADFYQLYQQFYQGMDIAKLDCLALQAEIQGGRAERIVNRGTALWLTGRNQVKECDPIFEHLRDNDLLGETEYAERFALAIDAREFAIARYLSKSLPAEYQLLAKQWTAVANNPRDFLGQLSLSISSEVTQQQALYALERIAYRQPEIAAELWIDFSSQTVFPATEAEKTQRYIALWAARRHSPEAWRLLDSLPDSAKNTDTLQWQLRAALLKHDWDGVALIAAQIPEPDEESLFWAAFAAAENGEDERALALFTTLATERSYYGFLASDLLSTEYNFGDIRVAANETMIEALAERDDLIRARELFFVGLEGRGRSEWDMAVSMLSYDEKQQAALLAHRWGWHSRAIATMASTGQLDDLRIRFPLPYQESVSTHASATGIPESWVYGVARSESLFMRDIRSSAGAIGLMQLMPETGRRTAREINLPYSGQATLTDPNSNIQLGTAYLRKLLLRFNNNQVLATAAYNAGPLNVDAWLPQQDAVDALIWIDNIPFTETRKYVRRVLAMDTIFHWRLTGEVQRLSLQLSAIAAVPPQVALTD